MILPGTVLPEGTVVSSMSVWGGNPGKQSLAGGIREAE